MWLSCIEPVRAVQNPPTRSITENKGGRMLRDAQRCFSSSFSFLFNDQHERGHVSPTHTRARALHIWSWDEYGEVKASCTRLYYTRKWSGVCSAERRRLSLLFDGGTVRLPVLVWLHLLRRCFSYSDPPKSAMRWVLWLFLASQFSLTKPSRKRRFPPASDPGSAPVLPMTFCWFPGDSNRVWLV